MSDSWACPSSAPAFKSFKCLLQSEAFWKGQKHPGSVWAAMHGFSETYSLRRSANYKKLCQLGCVLVSILKTLKIKIMSEKLLYSMCISHPAYFVFWSIITETNNVNHMRNFVRWVSLGHLLWKFVYMSVLLESALLQADLVLDQSQSSRDQLRTFCASELICCTFNILTQTQTNAHYLFVCAFYNGNIC